MNRQIKFRVWDKQKKEWFPLKNAMCLILNPESTDLCFMTKQGPYPIPQTDQENGGLNRFIIQQFTGLTDSTGKEIYEGDIIQGIIIGPVEFFFGEFSIGGVTPLKEWLPDADKIDFENPKLDLAVIGNLFETPDLLK